MSWGDIAAFATALAALLTAYFGFWKVRKDSRAQRDAESSSAVAAHMARQDQAITRLEIRADAAAVRERHMGDYVYQLREHIANGKPPPPPPWPEALLHTPDRYRPKESGDG